VFWMHFARTVTHSTVEECKQRMSLAEFRHWKALFRIEPWGDEWSQVRAQSASSLAPWNKKVAHNLPEFFPESKAQQSTLEMESKLNVFARRHNERVKKGK
jgi:hypothetical protein